MKNSASNPTITQAEKRALQAQAEELLPSITHALLKLDYQKVAHQRLSQQNNNLIMYQGLTRATHVQFGKVMIKWQLSSGNSQNKLDLNHEISVIKALAISKQSQKKSIAIAPPFLDYKTINIGFLAQTQQLTLLVMPYYLKGSLAQGLKQSLTDSQKHELILQAAKVIANLHRSGWVHGDIKPSNILIEDNLSLLLTDFALAQRINKDFTQNFDKYVRGNSAGTPAYLAPECWRGQGATVQSDIYAFGIMTYEILVGMRPFNIKPQSNEPLKDWAIQHCQQPIPTLPRRYAYYQRVVEKALAKRVERCYLSMEEVFGDLKGL